MNWWVFVEFHQEPGQHVYFDQAGRRIDSFYHTHVFHGYFGTREAAVAKAESIADSLGDKRDRVLVVRATDAISIRVKKARKQLR